MRKFDKSFLEIQVQSAVWIKLVVEYGQKHRFYAIISSTFSIGWAWTSLGREKAKPTTWIFTSKALGSGQGMTLKEIFWFSVEALQSVNAYPDNHNAFGLGCHLEIIIKHRLAHGISCTSRPTWEQPVRHCSAASAPQHINYRLERQNKLSPCCELPFSSCPFKWLLCPQFPAQ